MKYKVTIQNIQNSEEEITFVGTNGANVVEGIIHVWAQSPKNTEYIKAAFPGDKFFMVQCPE
jgi:hypothetical protein